MLKPDDHSLSPSERISDNKESLSFRFSSSSFSDYTMPLHKPIRQESVGTKDPTCKDDESAPTKPLRRKSVEHSDVEDLPSWAVEATNRSSSFLPPPANQSNKLMLNDMSEHDLRNKFKAMMPPVKPRRQRTRGAPAC